MKVIKWTMLCGAGLFGLLVAIGTLLPPVEAEPTGGDEGKRAAGARGLPAPDAETADPRPIDLERAARAQGYRIVERSEENDWTGMHTLYALLESRHHDAIVEVTEFEQVDQPDAHTVMAIGSRKVLFIETTAPHRRADRLLQTVLDGRAIDTLSAERVRKGLKRSGWHLLSLEELHEPELARIELTAYVENDYDDGMVWFFDYSEAVAAETAQLAGRRVVQVSTPGAPKKAKRLLAALVGG